MAKPAFDALRCCRLFHNLGDEDLKSLVPLFKELRIAQGEALFWEGEEGDAFFLIFRGSVRLCRRVGENKSLSVADLGPGEIFGEMSLISRACRSTDCIALEDSNLWCLSRQDFEALELSNLSAHALVLRNLTSLLAERLDGATSEVAHLLEELSAAESRKEDLQKRVALNRSGLLGFLASWGS